jgi:hippurate hydrolase
MSNANTDKTDSELLDYLIRVRRLLHQHPEASGQEVTTAEFVCKELSKLGIPYKKDVAGHGIVAEIPGKKPGPFIALRADMDGLPIVEETELPFSSQNHGLMHACAHDGHMAIVLGAAKILTQTSPHELPIRLIFQPSEETGEGALKMIDSGVINEVAMIFGGHIDRHYQTGQLVVTAGPVNASTDVFEILISGQSGHGARPHETKDAILVGGLLLMALQTIVSREVDPSFPAVVTVGEFHAGTAPNVISGSAKLSGTVRAQHDHVRQQLEIAIKRISIAVGDLHGAQVEVKFFRGTPPIVVTEPMAEISRQAAAKVVPQEDIFPLRTANMGGEDFAFYLEQIPGSFIRYGAQLEGKESYPAHSSKFDFDEGALIYGARYMAEVALIAIEKLSKENA